MTTRTAIYRQFWAGVALCGCVWGCGGAAPVTDTATSPSPTPISPVVSEPTTVAPTSLPAPTASESTASEPPTATPVVLDPAAVAAFEKLTRNNISAEEFEAAQEELLSLGSNAAAVVAAGLDSNQDLERELASTVLLLLGPEAITEVQDRVVTALQDESGFVRGNAASVLILTEDHFDQAVKTLIELLSSSDLGLRQLAAMNLQAQPEAAAAHLSQLVARLENEDNVTVLVPLIELIAAMGPLAAEASPVLQSLSTSSDPSVRPAATAALQQVAGTVQQTQATVGQ